MVQAFFQDQLVQFQLCHDLLQPGVLFLKSTQFQQLGSHHSAKQAAPVAIPRVTDADTATRCLYIAALCELQFIFAQQLQDVAVRIPFSSHAPSTFSAKVVGKFCGVKAARTCRQGLRMDNIRIEHLWHVLKQEAVYFE